MSELGRRAVHVSGSILPGLYLIDVATWPQVQYVLLAATAIALTLEAIRLTKGIDFWAYEKLTRDYEHSRVAGYALAIVGGTVTAVAFEPFVAVPALFMLTIGDPVSGILSGDDLGVKRGYVFLAMFGVCMAIASLLLVPFWPAVAGAGAATAADGFKPTIAGRVIDDNLSIPIAAGVAMQLGVVFL